MLLNNIFKGKKTNKKALGKQPILLFSQLKKGPSI
jgi:hypothetical protein